MAKPLIWKPTAGEWMMVLRYASAFLGLRPRQVMLTLAGSFHNVEQGVFRRYGVPLDDDGKVVVDMRVHSIRFAPDDVLGVYVPRADEHISNVRLYVETQNEKSAIVVLDGDDHPAVAVEDFVGNPERRAA